MDRQGAFSSVAEFNAVHWGGKPPFDPANLPKDLNFSSMVFTVEAIESRS